jgi:hypothetical protein
MICFRSKSVDSRFTNIQFHEASSTPTLYTISIGLGEGAIISRNNNTKNFDIICKKEIWNI